MANLAELREFYIQQGVQGEDLRFDGEGRLLLNGDIPDNETWTKILLSTAFRLNSSDRAKNSDDVDYFQENTLEETKVLQGLVTVATDTQAKSFENGSEGEYTRTIRPSQNHEVISGAEQSVSINDEELVSTVLIDINNVSLGSDSRNKYQPSISNEFISYLKTVIENETFPLGTVSMYSGTKEQLISSNRRFLVLDGSSLGNENSEADYAGEEYRSLYNHLQVRLGVELGTSNASFNLGIPINLSDMSGKFARGLGSFTGGDGIVYSSEDLGVTQLSSLPEHNHDLSEEVTGTTDSGVGVDVQTGTGNTTTDATVNNIGSEIRPVNQAFNYIIKY